MQAGVTSFQVGWAPPLRHWGCKVIGRLQMIAMIRIQVAQRERNTAVDWRGLAWAKKQSMFTGISLRGNQVVRDFPARFQPPCQGLPTRAVPENRAENFTLSRFEQIM